MIRALNLHRVKVPGLNQNYQNSDLSVRLWISGMGEQNASKSIHRLMKETIGNCTNVDAYWFNIGIGGLISGKAHIGTFHQIQTIYSNTDPLNSPAITGFPVKADLSSAKLVTVQTPLTDRNQLNQTIHPNIHDPRPLLVDMEAYTWAKTLVHEYKIPAEQLICIKQISDFATGEKINFEELAKCYDSGIVGILHQLGMIGSK